MQNRRAFLSQLTGLASAGGIAIASRSAEASIAQPAVAQAAAPASQTWDLAWMDSLKGRHKQLYDLMWHIPIPNTLNPPMFYFDVHKDLSQLAFPDINVVIGINNTSFGINASDAVWAKFKLGEKFNIKDPATGQPAARNIYLGQATGETRSTVRTLQARGAIFMQCDKALRGIAADFARQSGKTAAEMRDELIAGLNPGVKLVPALTWAVGALQERGFTYERL